MSVAKQCNCQCHRTASFRHMVPCCSAPTADFVRRNERTVLPPEDVSKERYLAIFREEGVDKEWAEIVYKRAIKAGAKLDERSVRQEAREWAKNDGF